MNACPRPVLVRRRRPAPQRPAPAPAGARPRRRGTRTAATRHHHDGGFVAGAEALLFSVLVFVVGTLVAVNAWSAIDARFATAAAAREAVRAAVTAGLGTDLDTVAQSAAREAFAGFGRDPASLTLAALTEPLQRRCQEIRYRASTTVRALPLPGVPGRAGLTVSSTHAGLVDPYRSGLPAGVAC